MTQTAFYRRYILSDAWRVKKQRIIAQRGERCELCGHVGGLQLHHLNYARLGRELDTDLQLLCTECHQTADSFRASETRYSNARATYIRKKYGDSPPADVDDEFEQWLERKQQND
jgi:hypothetical protein